MRWAAWVAVGLFACGGSSAAPGDGGSGSPGPSDAGSSDAGSGTDAGPGDAGYSADCIGVVPAAPGTGYTFDAPAGACTDATSDGKGAIAALGGQPASAWWEFDARGTPRGNFVSGMAMAQPEGFIGVATSQTGRALAWYDENGNTNPTMPIASDAVVAPAWQGGALVFGGGKVALFDSTALPVGSVPVASGQFAGGAQDASGMILALTGGISAMWIDLDRGTAGAPFTIHGGSQALARPLAGGGIAVRIDGHWTATLQPGDSTIRPAPAWLGDGDDFRIVEGAKAYAVVHGAAIGFFSAQGNACGSMTFTGQSAVSVGLDGTVIGSSGAGGCTKVFWPGLLK